MWMWEPLHIAGGSVKWLSCHGSLMVPQKVKHNITTWPSNPTPRHVSKRIKNRYSDKYMYVHVHSSIQKVKMTQMSIKGWMDKQIVAYPYSGILFSHEKEWRFTTWMNLENMMLSKRSQIPMVMYRMIPLMWNVQNRQVHRDRKQIRGCQGLEEGGMGSDCLMGTRFLFGVMTMF